MDIGYRTQNPELQFLLTAHKLSCQVTRCHVTPCPLPPPNPSASPAPPFGITVLEGVRDAMVLSWKQPAFAGGADITGYFVDYREVIEGVAGQWHEANIKAVSERAYRVRLYRPESTALQSKGPPYLEDLELVDLSSRNTESTLSQAVGLFYIYI